MWKLWDLPLNDIYHQKILLIYFLLEQYAYQLLNFVNLYVTYPIPNALKATIPNVTFLLGIVLRYIFFVVLYLD